MLQGIISQLSAWAPSADACLRRTMIHLPLRQSLCSATAAWQIAYGGDPSVVGSIFDVEGRPFTVIGVSPPGFFGETLRGDPPDIWIPVQQEPLIDGESTLLHQPVSAWLRIIGRLRPGASIVGMSPRLTGVLRNWMQHDSGYPSNWMPGIIRMLPKQVDQRRARRRRRRGDERRVWAKPARFCWPFAVWCC